MSDIVERLRENIIADAFEQRHVVSGELAERLIRERQDAADEIEKLRAALNDIEAYVEGRVIAHRDIAELAESSMSGKKQRVRASEAADILGKIRAAAAALKETGND